MNAIVVVSVAAALFVGLGIMVAAAYEYSLVRYRVELEGAGVRLPAGRRRLWQFLQRVILWPYVVWSTLATIRDAGDRSRQVRRAQDRSATRHVEKPQRPYKRGKR